MIVFKNGSPVKYIGPRPLASQSSSHLCQLLHVVTRCSPLSWVLSRHKSRRNKRAEIHCACLDVSKSICSFSKAVIAPPNFLPKRQSTPSRTVSLSTRHHRARLREVFLARLSTKAACGHGHFFWACCSLVHLFEKEPSFVHQTPYSVRILTSTAIFFQLLCDCCVSNFVILE